MNITKICFHHQLVLHIEEHKKETKIPHLNLSPVPFFFFLACHFCDPCTLEFCLKGWTSWISISILSPLSYAVQSMAYLRQNKTLSITFPLAEKTKKKSFKWFKKCQFLSFWHSERLCCFDINWFSFHDWKNCFKIVWKQWSSLMSSNHRKPKPL